MIGESSNQLHPRTSSSLSAPASLMSSDFVETSCIVEPAHDALLALHQPPIVTITNASEDNQTNDCQSTTASIQTNNSSFTVDDEKLYFDESSIHERTIVDASANLTDSSSHTKEDSFCVITPHQVDKLDSDAESTHSSLPEPPLCLSQHDRTSLDKNSNERQVHLVKKKVLKQCIIS